MYDQLMKTLNRAVVKTFPTKATYSGLDLGVVYIDVVFDHNYEAYDEQTGAIVQSNEPMCSIVLADLARDPIEGDEIEINGIAYRVVTFQEDSEGMAKLQLREL